VELAATAKRRLVDGFVQKCTQCCGDRPQYRYMRDLESYWGTIKYKQLTHIDCGFGVVISCLRLLGKWKLAFQEVYEDLLKFDTATYILDIAHMFAEKLQIDTF
jgi:hypothetical protein